jgi:hypothetical protein
MTRREVGDGSAGLSWPMVGRMRCTANYDFQNYFSIEKCDVACGDLAFLHVGRLMTLSGL